MNNPMMECGHAANGLEKSSGLPVCIICTGIHPGARTVVAIAPDLTGRQATCDCGRLAPSENRQFLAFFSYRPDRDTDHYYCGHSGWD